MLGQAINKVGYERRLLVLSSLNDNKQAKKQLKDNQDEIKKESKFLFGEEFQKQLKTCAFAQESADKLLSRPGKRKWMTSNSRPNHGGSSNYATTKRRSICCIVPVLKEHSHLGQHQQEEEEAGKR